MADVERLAAQIREGSMEALEALLAYGGEVREEERERCAKIAFNGQSGNEGDPSHLVAYDDNGIPNAFNTCILIAEEIRAGKKQ